MRSRRVNAKGHKRGIKVLNSKRVKLRSVVGVIEKKNNLKLALLNIDGLSLGSLEDIREVCSRKKPDLVFILETKRREEDVGFKASIDGYSLTEVRRSDAAGDRGGGGIAVYTRQVDGLVYHEFQPDIKNELHHFVNKERVWIQVESASTKTAVCGAYFGCQTATDIHGQWNDSMYEALHAEETELRARGFRVIMMADFNAHVGNSPEEGIRGNHQGVNPNGRRFLDFLSLTKMKHINGQQHLTKGLWTRQRGSSKTIIDYATISEEHLLTVQSLFIDDKGAFPGGSDHNWMFLTVNDHFVKKRRMVNIQNKKPRWNIGEEQDWRKFQEFVRSRLRGVNCVELSVDELASLVSSCLLAAGMATIGLKIKDGKKKKAQLYPRVILDEIFKKRELEKEWKTAIATSVDDRVIAEKEALKLKQKALVENLLFNFTHQGRPDIVKKCAQNTTGAIRCFWSHVSRKTKQAIELSAVVDPVSGVLKCDPEEVRTEVGEHLRRTFQGSYDPVGEEAMENPQVFQSQHSQEHSYGVNLQPALKKVNDSGSLEDDPAGWMDRKYSLEEVGKNLRQMTGGKAVGFDTIPNEFLINAPEELLVLLTELFNKIQESGKTPRGWNKGVITLVFKKGLRELLKNYRPLTVIISLCGLYSRVLNGRLTEVVENQGLLGEEQNGFRKGRRMADNNFLLDTVLWKAKALGKDVHLAFLDISKAYDTVCRSILWQKLARMGFGGKFLRSLQALYSGDSVECMVNGSPSRPLYLRRGLRQGCSLSPILFALYISDIGNDLTNSSVGWEVGGLVLSGLLFADDIVLMAETADGLKELISLVNSHCVALRLEVSVEKSQVVSPDGEGIWDIFGDGENVLTLKSVLSYKYLGTETSLLMSKTGSSRQKRCLATARRYRFACHYVAKTGPDMVDVALATWNNIAMPSILSGCEVIPFSDSTIEEIEVIQSQMAKRVLDLPVSAPNLCAQTELGVKPFRLVLWQSQLSFYLRAMQLPESRWVSRALKDHLSGEWESPYISYMTRVRSAVGLLDMGPSLKYLKAHLESWAVVVTNTKLEEMSGPSILPVKKFSRQVYVGEEEGCSTLATFRLGCAGLGNRVPLKGERRQRLCQLCSGVLSEQHVAFSCPALDRFRRDETDIVFFRNHSRRKGILEKAAYVRYVNGFDHNGLKVIRSDMVKRGLELKGLRKCWLRLKGY